MQEAVATCRKGKGPVLIEAKTYRHGGHHVNDPGLYMPKERLEYYRIKDPVGIGRKYLLEQGNVSEETVGSIEREIDRQMDEAVQFASNSPHPSVERFLEEVQPS
jgi:pyruvate dehydrogenase E1 component alpha subunit